MTLDEHRDEGLRRRHRRLASSIDRVDMAIPDEMGQVQVGEVAARGTVDRVVFGSDQDPEFRGDPGIGRELAKLRGGAPRFNAQEHKIHVAPFEDVNLEHRRADLDGKIVLRDESDDSPTRQDVRHIPSLVESPSRGPQENDDQPRPLQSLLRLSAEPVNGFDLVSLGQGFTRRQYRRAANEQRPEGCVKQLRTITAGRAKYYIPLLGWAACGRDGLAW